MQAGLKKMGADPVHQMLCAGTAKALYCLEEEGVGHVFHWVLHIAKSLANM